MDFARAYWEGVFGSGMVILNMCNITFNVVFHLVSRWRFSAILRNVRIW